ncbi:rare lipoprotein A [Nitrosococcus halophilus Nc 4]|uniref:Endolytic peptidoglycan transglycosylase RlpA n=1 Tax=Nitrosococcus halophilus (strain Nc4) TaxID=472759 RepID=D5BWA8_NITHN|nr:septal ring lytic transglycosylase RlpA family protein [Nitrosococcus halophilus]ADE13758.1 rare lipoprotein A [Nitrosococcus halophilus Nc 4]
MRSVVPSFLLPLVVLFNVSCSNISETRESKPPANDMPGDVSDPLFRFEPLSKYGNPPVYEVNGQRYHTLRSSRGYREKGIASWYGSKFHGRRTSSGETYDMYGMTAAHRSLPLPSYVVVTNLSNQRQVVLRVNDRGPFHSDRIIDLSYAAAVKLGLAREGTGLVEVRAIEPRSVSGRKGEVAEKEIYLQVGAFQNRRHAERLQKQLQSVLGTGVNVSPTTAQQVPFYRVRVGPLPNVEKLDNLAKQLAELGYPDHIIVH